MPLTSSGKKVLGNMSRQYGAKKGKSVFYASMNKGTLDRKKLEQVKRHKKHSSHNPGHHSKSY